MRRKSRPEYFSFTIATMSQPSLAQLLKTHNQHQADKKRHNDQLKKDAAHAVHELTDAVSLHVNEGISDIFLRQKELEQESRKLANQTAKYTKQTNQWLSLVDNFNSALKEIGDVRNWAQIMENDMRAIMTTLEFVHQGTIDGKPVERGNDHHTNDTAENA
ncbi:GCN5-like protein 1-domain-containing protein [Radiomyces spectabilis]|uniref:GCN5-like protein 1-domain-containing protein n=1 Tax=Radiomyces spectabilis TaxID=64574 RepID=UPI00221FE6A5|nr:GCN5-like protein 1-domain-containing protein [Radiomyces spectabilis]KAI8379343.1 GCN5-like protein 1-domain-containing protein [Radiomyces spectabilis]